MVKQIILILVVVFNINIALSQNTLKDSTTKEALVGATAVIKGTTNGASAMPMANHYRQYS